MMHPWYRNFNGTITEELVKGETRYSVTGAYNIRDECTLEITELPLRSWTSDYKEFLEDMLTPKTKNAKPFITDYKEYHTDSTVHFVITMPPENLAAAQASGLEKKFKLSTKLNITNMHLFNQDGVITKYSSPLKILEAFVPLRLNVYSQRRDMLIRLAESQLKRLSNKMRFILAVVDGSLVVNRKKKQELIEELDALCYDRLLKTDKGSLAAVDETGSSISAEVAGASYDYLLGMPLWNLTLEKVDELCAEKEAKEAEVAALHETTEKDLWMKDLDTLEQALELLEEEDEEARRVLEKQQRAAARNNTAAGKKAAKKKLAKQRAANSDEEDEWDDDDFSDDDFEIAKPKKKAASKKKAAPKAAPAPAPVVAKEAPKTVSDDEETEPMSLAERLALRGGAALSKPASKPAASAFNMSSINAAVDEVATKPAPAKKAAAPKRAPAKKVAVLSDSEEDFDEDSDSEVAAPVAPRSTARPARARSTKTYVEEDSEDSEDDFSEEEDDESDFSMSE